MPLQIRRGTEAERQSLTSVNGLVVGELLYVTDDRKLYVGTGNYSGAPSSGPNAWWKGAVATSYNDDDAKSAAGTALISGTHQNITFTYDNIAKTISSTLDLSDYDGTIKASSFKGSLLADDGSTISGIVLVDGINGSINLDGTVKGNIVPDLNITWDIGTPLLRFRDLYLSGSSIYLGNAQITSNIDGTVNLPAGSTVGGVDIAGGSAGGVINADIIGDDSTVIVNVSTKSVTAAGGFFGNLNGTLTGTVTGNLIGTVTGDTTGYHFGDMTGSVFADDSTLMIDGVTNTISTGLLTLNGSSIVAGLNTIDLVSELDEPINVLGVTGISVPFSAFQFVRGSTSSPTNTLAGDVLGGIKFTGYHSSTQVNAVAVAVDWDSTANFLNSNPASNLRIFVNDNASGVQQLTFDYRGVLSGPKSFECHRFADSAARAAAIATPSPGMITYLEDDGSGTPKFQGYKGAPTNAWVDLG